MADGDEKGYEARSRRRKEAEGPRAPTAWWDLPGIFSTGGEEAEKAEDKDFEGLDQQYKRGDTADWTPEKWETYVRGAKKQYEDVMYRLYPRGRPLEGKKMGGDDFETIEKYRGILYEIKNIFSGGSRPSQGEGKKINGLTRFAYKEFGRWDDQYGEYVERNQFSHRRVLNNLGQAIKDLENPYFRSMEASNRSQYEQAQQKIHQYNKNIDLLTKSKKYFQYTIPRLPLNSPLRKQMEQSLQYVTRQIETLQKQSVAEAAKAHAAKKQEIAENQQQQKQKEQGKEKATEDNKAKTTETPNKPAAPEAKKDPDEELNNIMTMMANLNKMQDAGADQFHVNWVAQVLARRMAAYSGNATPGMSDAQYAMLPPHMRSPFGAMVNRASYEQSLRKKTEDYYTNSHLPRPNWLQNLDKLDQSAQIDLLRQMSPALVPDAKSLPGPSRSSWGGMDYKGFSIPKSDSNTISDTPQLKAPSGSSNLSMEEDESRQMGYNPYGTSYPNLGNLSPGMDMSNMLGDNYLMNQMMSRQGVPPYPMA